MTYNAENNFESFKRTLNSTESYYADDCWVVFKMAVEFKILHTMDMEEELPELPFNIPIRQGYMIRQTLFDLALNLKKEKEQLI